jgi:hypothetical protein
MAKGISKLGGQVYMAPHMEARRSTTRTLLQATVTNGKVTRRILTARIRLNGLASGGGPGHGRLHTHEWMRAGRIEISSSRSEELPGSGASWWHLEAGRSTRACTSSRRNISLLVHQSGGARDLEARLTLRGAYRSDPHPTHGTHVGHREAVMTWCEDGRE